MHDLLAVPDGVLRQRQVALQGVLIGAAHDAPSQLVQPGGGQGGAEHRLVACAVGVEGAFEHALAQPLQRAVPVFGLAAPPGGQGGQRQRLAQQVLADGGQVAQQRARFQRGRAGRVGQQQMARTQRLHQARHAQVGVGAQLERVQPLVVQGFDQHIDGLQPLDGFEIQALLAHRQVVALNQVQPQVARQVGVLKVAAGVGAAGEQGHARLGPARRERLQALHQRLVAGR